jgi:outer membrane immunogenic protein
MTLRRLGAIVLAAFAVSSTAVAADKRAPIYKAPPVVYDPWSGGYIGVNIGYSWGNWSASSSQPVFNFEVPNANPKVNGVLGGVQAGFNLRPNRQWLVGFEADVQITGEKAAQSWVDPELPPTIAPPPPDTETFVPRPGGPATLSHDWSFPWFATLRLRAGVTPVDNWLLYVTGGLAVGETRYNFAFSQPGAAGNVPPTATTYALSTRNTRLGFTVGVGSEAHIDLNWSVKLEYLYVDLGTVSINTLDIDGAPYRVDYHARDHILRIGLNYRFNDPVVARY